MAAPLYSIIVPVKVFPAGEPVLASLRRRQPPTGIEIEILVAEGSQPAGQRNFALSLARGERIVFLDNDCELAENFWDELEGVFARPEVDIVGGPALLREGGTAGERICHALLSHPLVVGPVAARYAARGVFRVAGPNDLILCNLAVRRNVFARIGSLSTRLYPNEENEWLDRARRAGVSIHYHPGLQVFRPQRTGPGQLLQTLFRYGWGRTQQLRVSRGRITRHHGLVLLFLLLVVALIFSPPARIVFGTAWLLAAMIVGMTSPGFLSPGQRCLAGLLAPLVPLVYAAGQLCGWVGFITERGIKPLRPVKIYNEKGELQTVQENG